MLGFIHFDRSGLKNHQTEMLVAQDRIGELVRNRYVIIRNPAENPGVPHKEFLGRLVEGPFFNPEELSRESALTQTAILRGDRFPVVPSFYAVGGIELLGELRGEQLFGASTRPTPQATVEDIAEERLHAILHIHGAALLGRMDGYDDLRVYLDPEDKAVLPRNVGIFGTVGSGKTNTSQALIEEAAKSGYAVIVLDVEGEYVAMDRPTQLLGDVLTSYGLESHGLDDFYVYYPHSSETARASGDARAFTLRTADLDPLVLSELIEAAEAQERRLLEVIDDLMRRNRPVGDDTSSQTSLRGVLTHGEEGDGRYTLQDIIDKIDEWAFTGRSTGRGQQRPATGADLASYLALKGKLGSLRRTRAFDVPGAQPIRVDELLVAGRVSIFDVSYTADRLKNLVIAQLLKKVFEAKVDDPSLPKTLIFIEEAHTFISSERVGRMQETVEMLREIARRGRKRWLGLVFISQQPAHLPAEIFELCNTRIVHNIKSAANLRSLRLTGGDVSEEMWNLVPSLGVGQAVISTPQYRDPLVVNVRPCTTMRQFVD